MTGSLVNDTVARTLLVTADALMGEWVGEVEVPAMVRLLVVQAVVKVLSATIKLLSSEMVREITGEVSAHGEATSSIVVSSRVVCPTGIFSMAIEDSSSGQLHNSPPCTS